MKPLSEEKKAEVKLLRKQGKTYRQIAEIAGISCGGVSYILKPRCQEQNKTCNIPKSLWDEWDYITGEMRKKDSHRDQIRRPR